jgi:hypothetical protein
VRLPCRVIALKARTRGEASRGFRAWEDDPAPQYVVCDCGWRPELGIHYRVAGTRERSGQKNDP